MFYLFSDGGCSNNGKKNAIASYCSMLIDGKEKKIIKGLVQPYKYNINFSQNIDDQNIANSFISIDKSIKITPSNNRGELIGIIYCLVQLYIVASKEETNEINVELYSDSLISINTLNIWLPNRRLSNTAHKMKNFDLIYIAEQLLAQITSKYKSIKILHTKSHQKKPSGENKKKLFIWLGNQLVDKECSILCNDKNIQN